MYTALVPEEKPSERRIHLKFSPVFVGRLRKYAKDHDMKLNAVVKRAFEVLEDHPELLERKGRYDY